MEVYLQRCIMENSNNGAKDAQCNMDREKKSWTKGNNQEGIIYKAKCKLLLSRDRDNALTVASDQQ